MPEFVEGYCRWLGDDNWQTITYMCDEHEQVTMHKSCPDPHQNDAWWSKVSTRRVLPPKCIVEKNKHDNMVALNGLIKARARLKAHASEQLDPDLKVEFEEKCSALIKQVTTTKTRVVKGYASLHVVLKKEASLTDINRIFGVVMCGARKFGGSYNFCNIEFDNLQHPNKILADSVKIINENVDIIRSIQKARNTEWFDVSQETINENHLECNDTLQTLKLADEINSAIDALSPEQYSYDIDEYKLVEKVTGTSSNVKSLKRRRSV